MAYQETIHIKRKWMRCCLYILFLLLSSACSEYERSIYDEFSPHYIGNRYVPIEIQPIDKVLDAGESPDSVKVQATIVATHTRGFLLYDRTGYILVNLETENGNTRNSVSENMARKADSYTIGDVVTVAGKIVAKGGLFQFTNTSKVTKVGTDSVKHTPEPKFWNAEMFHKYIEDPFVEYVQYTGTLSTDNNNYIVTVSDGTATALVQIAYPASGIIGASSEGKEIVVTGYTIGYTDNKYVSTMATSVEVVAEAIDLGLSVKWASWNVGATAPEEYGGYYAWGETEVKDNYEWSTYKWCNGTYSSMTKYCTSSSYGTVDNKTTLDPEDDVAHVKWGDGWRMPTWDEMKELVNNCSWEETTVNGVNGCKVSGNGNSIFIPNAGICTGTELNYCGSRGSFLSSTLHEDGSRAYNLELFNGGFGYGLLRIIGQSVRPVQGEVVVGEEDEEHEEAILATFINVSIKNGYPEDEDWGGGDESTEPEIDADDYPEDEDWGGDDDESAEPEIDADDYLEDENWGGGADESTDPEIDADDYPEDENWGDGNDESTDPEIDADDYPEDENWGGGADESTDPKIDADDYSEDENWGGGDEEFAEPEIDADDYPEDENWGSGDDESTDSDIDIEDYSSEEDWNDSGNESANSEIQMNGYADDEDWSNQ